MNKINELFKIYPILNSMSGQTRRLVEGTGSLMRYSYGEYINNKNTNCMGFMFILKGSIKIYRINKEGKETFLYNIGKGEICHEALSCMMKKESLNIIGEAKEETEIYFIPLNILESSLMKEEKFVKYLYLELYDKFRGVISDKEEIIHESLEERLIQALNSRKSKYIYATHQELAIEIGSSREVVSRKLKELEKLGQVKLSRGKIEIIK